MKRGKDRKLLDKSVVAGKRMKAAYIRAKEKAATLVENRRDTPDEYAAEQVQSVTEDVACETAYTAVAGTEAAIRHGKELVKSRIASAKQGVVTEPVSENLFGGTVMEQAGDTTQAVKSIGTKGQDRTVKTAERVVKTGRYAPKSVVKTVKPPVYVPVETAQTAAKERFVQTTAMTAHKAADAARETRKATTAVVKGTAMVTAVKSMVGTAQKLTATLAAGGGIAVTVIVLICLIGMSVGSGFGVFFSSQDTGSQVMTEIVREIDEEYNAKIEAIKSAVAYDALELNGSKAAWKEVLAVYAVKTTTDSNTPQEVATTNEGKKTLLREVFWAMNEVSYYTTTDDDGTQTTLHITVTHKSADEMAEEYGFRASQRKQLQELLAEENNSLWNFVLYGVVGGSDEIVAVALSQLGNVGGEPYWSWYGFSSHVEWCACFVSWCANECGYLDAGIVPKFASCAVGVSWFQSQGQWLDNTTEPVPGMIIFFDWDSDGQDGLPDHVGIVEKVENGRVYTVEGNSSDQCRERSYPVGYYEILGYGSLGF